MKNLTRLFSGMLALSLLGGMNVACQKGGNDSGKTTSPNTTTPAQMQSESPKDTKSTETGKAGDKDIVVAGWNDAADALTKIAEAYNKKTDKPEGKVIVNYVDSNYDKLRPALLANQNVPDIFQTQNRDFPAFMETYGDVFLNVNDLIEKEKDNLVGAALALCKNAKDNNYYAVPWDIGPCAWMYREDVFKEAGIDVESINTWEDYVKAGKTIKEKTGKYVFAFSYTASSLPDDIYTFIQQQEGSFFDKDGKVKFNTPEMVNAFKLLLKAKEEGIAVDTPDVWNDRIKACAEDKLVSLPYAVWYCGTMKNSIKDSAGKWRITRMPGFKQAGERASIGGSILAASKTTRNPELVKDFLRFALLTNEGNDINLEFGLFSSHKPAYQSEMYKKTDAYFGGQSVGVEFAKYADTPLLEYGSQFTTVSQELTKAAAEIMSGAALESTLEKYEQSAQNMINQLS